MDFSEVIGQEEAKQRLLAMEESGKLPHALLLCGPEGCGKMALALAFACHLLSRKSNANVEAMLRQLAHPDLHFSFPTIKLPSMSSDHKPVSDDFAQAWHQLILSTPYFALDDWLAAMGAENQQAIITAGESDLLIRKLSMKSSQGGYKVSVIWLPERMNIECANKILKLIEEPPSQTIFIMVSEAPDLLIETIRSRTQRIDMKRIETSSIAQELIARRALDEATAQRIARLSNGSWLKALQTLAANSETADFLKDYQQLMRLAYMRDIKQLKRWSEEMASYGREKQKRLLTNMLRLTRENFIYNFSIPDLNYMSVQEEEFSKKFARFINEDNVLAFNELLNLCIRDISQNANGKMVFFDLALKTIMLLKH